MSGVNTSGHRDSVWIERDDLLLDTTPHTYSELVKDAETDVVVVGGGIAGLHIAYELLSTGTKKVIVVEDGKICSGETGRTTGHLSVDNEYNEFINIHGPEGTADIAAAQQAAIERIATIVEKHKIDCDFVRVPGYMFHGLRAEEKGFQLDTLQSIWKAASDTGKLDMTLVDDAAIPGFPSGRAIRFDRQATFHPTKYVRALAKVITEELGGTIDEKTRMADYEEIKSATRGVTVNMTNGKKIVADQLVMATNVPLQKLVIIDQVSAYRSYAVALKIADKDISSNGEPALWWDLADPYHYIRVTPHKEPGYSLLVVGGEDEKVGQHDDAEARYKRLIEWTRARWSGAGAVEYQWSGQVIESVDGIALTGLNPGSNHVYIHTADNGDGLTYAAIGGMVIRDLIVGHENRWAATFSPSRQHDGSHIKRALKVLPDYVMENVQDQIYYAKWITRCTHTLADIEDLVPGQGTVVRDGIQPLAVYKDEGGAVHKMTAICPHLKGIVAWNKDEKSFDCPIHGSRFTCRGEIVNGPAKMGLVAK